MGPKKQSRGQVFTRPRPGHEQRPGHKHRLFWWGLVTVVALAFILRLAWVLNVHTYPISELIPHLQRGSRIASPTLLTAIIAF